MQQEGEPDMEFPQHILLVVGAIAAFAGCLIALACVAIAAVLGEPRKDAVSGEILLVTASSASGRPKAARFAP